MNHVTDKTDALTGQDLAAALGPGIESGDTILVHASLKAIGWLEGGPGSLIRVLLDLVGAKGNLVMLTASRQFARTGFFDVRNSPSDVGALSEAFRRYPGVRRSLNPMVSFAAIGPDSERFLARYDSYLDRESPFAVLLALDGKVMLYGVDYDKCTLFHLSEERAAAQYNFYKTFSGVVRNENGEDHPTSQTYFVRRDMTTKKDPRPAGRRFEQSHRVFTAKLGRGTVRIFSARAFDAFCDRAIAEDPEVFLSKAG